MTQEVHSDWTLVNFLNFEKSLNGGTSVPFHGVRKGAFESFSRAGFPTPQREEWKYTNIAPLREIPFSLVNQPNAVEAHISIPNLQCITVSIQDSHFIGVSGDLPSGITVESLKKALKSEGSKALEQYLSQKLSNTGDDSPESFAALNTAFVNDGVFIRVKKNTHVSVPIHLAITAGNWSDKTIRHPRIVCLVEEGASVSIVETIEGPNSQRYCNNSVVQFFLLENAVVDHYRVQKEGLDSFHVSTIDAVLERSANFRTHTFSFGAKLARNHVNVTMKGTGCNTTMNGLSALTGAQHVDNQTLLDNQAPNCESLELYKGIYGEKSQGVFSGTIIVRQIAQKTNAIQSNRSLLLSDEASVNTKPQLKIWADDVKCTHGATVGQLDDDALFYIKSRGVSEKDARVMLIHAFASEIISQVRIEPLRLFLENQLLEKLQLSE